MKRGEDAAGAVSSFPLIDAGLGGSGLVSKRALKHVLGEIRDASGLSLALFGGKGELLALSEGEGQLFEELEKEGLVSDRLKEYVRSLAVTPIPNIYSAFFLFTMF